MTRGIFITLEGPEGAGKTTQRGIMAEFFKERGLAVTLTREPGGTPAAEELREFILRPRDEQISGTAEVLLFFAARALHVENVIKPALARGDVVLCDRFVDSTYAYQAAGRGIKPETIRPIEEYAIGQFAPDKTFLFDLDPPIGLARAAARGKLDRFETEHHEFFERVRLAYLAQVNRKPWQYAVIDASKSVEEVSSDVRPYLEGIYEAYRLNKTLKQD